LVSLQCRRNVADVKFLCKLIVGEVDCPELLEKISFRVPRLNWRDKSNFLLPLWKTNIIAGSPLIRMFDMGNSLAEEVDLFNCTTKNINDAAFLYFAGIL
jgi:hypothetical protein